MLFRLVTLSLQGEVSGAVTGKESGERRDDGSIADSQLLLETLIAHDVGQYLSCAFWGGIMS
jgi:hypothetical protein